MTKEEFIAHINEHLNKAKITPSAFGKSVMGDPNFVFDLWNSPRSPSLKTINRVLQAIGGPS